MKPTSFITLAVAGFLLAGCAAPLPSGVSRADVMLFEEGMAKAGCVVSNDKDAAVVEKHTGFGEAKLKEISRYMLEQESLQHEGTGIKLTTGNCADA